MKMTQITGKQGRSPLHGERQLHCRKMPDKVPLLCSNIHAHYLALNLSFLVLFLRIFFLDQLLAFVRREIDEISISCEGLPAMHIGAEKRKDKR